MKLKRRLSFIGDMSPKIVSETVSFNGKDEIGEDKGECKAGGVQILFSLFPFYGEKEDV